MATFDSNCFTYDASTGKLVAEMSELSHRVGGNIWDQIYEDACDLGFSIRSIATGKVVKFAVHKEEHDGDGDVTGWILKAVKDHRSYDPVLDKLIVVVFND